MSAKGTITYSQARSLRENKWPLRVPLRGFPSRYLRANSTNLQIDQTILIQMYSEAIDSICNVSSLTAHLELAKMTVVPQECRSSCSDPDAFTAKALNKRATHVCSISLTDESDYTHMIALFQECRSGYSHPHTFANNALSTHRLACMLHRLQIHQFGPS